jgi:hypothetical protein
MAETRSRSGEDGALQAAKEDRRDAAAQLGGDGGAGLARARRRGAAPPRRDGPLEVRLEVAEVAQKPLGADVQQLPQVVLDRSAADDEAHRAGQRPLRQLRLGGLDLVACELWFEGLCVCGCVRP